MKWYLAKLTFRIICADGNHTPQFDDQIRMVAAANMTEAVEKSAKLGFMEEDTFLNDRNKPVQWKFVAVTEIYPIVELMDGAEVYSRIYEMDDAPNYTRLIQDKALQLERIQDENLVLLESAEN